jgi:hypothetical protein
MGYSSGMLRQTTLALILAATAAVGATLTASGQVIRRRHDPDLQDALQRLMQMQRQLQMEMEQAMREMENDPFFSQPRGDLQDPMDILRALEQEMVNQQSQAGGHLNTTPFSGGLQFSVVVNQSQRGGASWSFSSRTASMPAVRTLETSKSFEFRIKRPEQDHTFDIAVEKGILTIEMAAANASKSSMRKSFRLPPSAQGDRFTTAYEGDQFVVAVPKR